MKIKVNGGHVEYVDHMGSDLTVVNSARVSFADHKEEFDEKDTKLINYLATHNHWTPFAHPQITLRIKAPISIRTQFFKHKQGFVENEISRRYVKTEPDFYNPRWRNKPSGGAKQGSDDFVKFSTTSIDKAYKLICDSALSLYQELIGKGVAPEQARFCFPQGMFTEWYWTGSLSAYARFYKQRSDPHAQWEIREYAKAVDSVLSKFFPVSWEALV